MMTSPSTNPIPALSRSVRDVVSQQPDVVNEVWCRKILRQVLQILEREHALKHSHAPISPDTVGLDELGEPTLLPAEPGAPEPGEAADVQALGMLIHYAITQEEVPTMSLRKRGLEAYSDSLVTAVDKCGAADPAARPQSIAELRNLLGIVALGPAIGAPAINPVYMQPVQLPRMGGGLAGMGKGTRWTLISLAAVVLLGAASAYWMMLHDTASDDNIVLSLPSAEPERIPAAAAPAATASQAPPAPQGAVAQSAEPRAESEPPPQAAPAVPPPAPAAPARARVAAAAPAPRERAAGRNAGAETGTTSYKLFIKPWGTVFVNGSDRGVSPPLKVLTLPPGTHTVRVVNPAFRDRIIKVHSISRGSGQIEVDFTE